MSHFSKRMGFENLKKAIQLESMDDTLKTKLWNRIQSDVFDRNYLHLTCDEHPNRKSFYSLWKYFFIEPLDKMPNFVSDYSAYIRNWFWGPSAEWHHIYDFMEFFINSFYKIKTIERTRCVFLMNHDLEIENSAYRFKNNIFVPFTDKTEIKAIEQGLSETSTGKFSPVHTHLSEALKMLSDRKNPDYRNSIKESISAVECILNIITAERHSGIKPALKSLKAKHPMVLHPALETAFGNIYGYTSNSNGIRHALSENSNVPFEDAKFMLVTCTAFVNYLLAKTAT